MAKRKPIKNRNGGWQGGVMGPGRWSGGAGEMVVGAGEMVCWD